MEIVSRPPRTIMRPGRNSTWVEIARAECREIGPPSLNRYLARMIRACFVSPLVFHACSNCSLTRANIPLGEEEIEEKERGGRERERDRVFRGTRFRNDTTSIDEHTWDD